MALVEIYRSAHLADCEQRAFLLYAVGVESHIEQRERSFVLLVAEDARRAAHEELQRHEAEARTMAAAQTRPVQTHAHAWSGALGYAAVIIAVAYFAGENYLGADWISAGALRSALAQSGEWHRLVTALTLHVDVAHLLANLVFGVVFGYYAGQLLGAGVAWLSILIASAGGNLLDSLLAPPASVSVGASTAVFATLGLVAAYSWRSRADRRMRWAHRWAPLIAGAALLAFTGAGGERTDVVAHVTGFICGAAVGAAHASPIMRRLRAPVFQGVSGAICVAVVVVAWRAALS